MSSVGGGVAFVAVGGDSGENVQNTMNIPTMVYLLLRFFFLLCYSCATHHISDTSPCVMLLDSMTRFFVSRFMPRRMTTSCYDVISICNL